MSVARLRRFGSFPNAFNAESRPEDHPERYAATVQDRVLAVFRDLDAKLTAIRGNELLSDIAKQRQSAELRKLTLAALENVEKSEPWNRIGNAVAALRKRARDLIARPEDQSPAAAIAESEVRTALRAMDPSARSEVIRQAIADGDAETFLAAARAPNAAPLIRPAERAAYEAEWLKRVDPALPPALAEAENAYAVVRENIAEVRAAVDEVLPDPDPRGRLAAV